MRNYIVSIYSGDEKIIDYNIEEENRTVARLLSIGKFKKDFPDYKEKNIRYIAKESKRKIVAVQEPKKWEFI